MSVHLVIDDLGYDYGRLAALRGLSVSLPAGEVLAVLGPSGSGKTTLLHLVAGLLRPTAGRIVLDGRRLADPSHSVPPESRNVSMVFQDFALWPHMTVFENVAFPLRVRRWAPPTQRQRVAELLAMLHLQGLSGRYPHELSGGQRQRVAMARALAPRPPLMLLDEPMSGLDARLREEMRVELAQTLRATATTALYVTHDRTEAMTIADRILLLDQGRAVQCGTPENLYAQPRSLFVAQFMGPANVLHGRALLDGESGGRAVFADAATGARLLGTPVGDTHDAELAVFRPEALRPVDSAGETSPNQLTGRVLHAAYLGHAWQHTVEIARGLTVVSTSSARLAGDVTLTVAAEDLLLLPA